MGLKEPPFRTQEKEEEELQSYFKASINPHQSPQDTQSTQETLYETQELNSREKICFTKLKLSF